MDIGLRLDYWTVKITAMPVRVVTISGFRIPACGIIKNVFLLRKNTILFSLGDKIL